MAGPDRHDSSGVMTRAKARKLRDLESREERESETISSRETPSVSNTVSNHHRPSTPPPPPATSTSASTTSTTKSKSLFTPTVNAMSNLQLNTRPDRVSTATSRTSSKAPIVDDVIFNSPSLMAVSPTRRYMYRTDANRFIPQTGDAQARMRAEFHAARHSGSVVAQLSPDRNTRRLTRTDAEYAISQRNDAYNELLYIELLGGEPSNPSRTRALDTPQLSSSYRRTGIPATSMSPSRGAGSHEQLIGRRSHESLINNYDEDGRLRNAPTQNNQSDVVRVPRANILNFGSPSRSASGRRYNVFNHVNHTDVPRVSPGQFASTLAASANMLSPASLSVLAQPRMPLVSVSSQPTKVLDAPEIADDYYLNLLDWSSSNLLGVGLGRNVYIWNAVTSDVTKLDEVDPDDSVTCLSWMPQGTHLAVATKEGIIKLWDVQRGVAVREYRQHGRRVCAMAWCDTMLASGGRGRTIVQRDVRDPRADIQRLDGHRGEVCGLRWSPSNTQLASGANDNQVFIWDKRRSYSRLWQFREHKAAVKAITWSPHQEGLLATGGGSQDGYIRFWNTLNGHSLNCVDTQSQVCNLAWSRHSNELVSTHGYAQNDLRIWRYPDLRQVNTFTGHTKRILYMAVSPDGRTVVTGTPDETLRFWQVFSHSRSSTREESTLSSSLVIR